MKKLLISGCSFTESRVNENEEWIKSNKSWIPYSDMIINRYKELSVTNKGMDSSSNGMIHNSIIDELVRNDFNYDFVIVQWSAVMRAHTKTTNQLVDTIPIPTGTFNPITFIHEYIAKNKMELGSVTNVLNKIDNQFYDYTLILIYSLQTILEKNNIPYFMFWGWEQITDSVYEEHNKLIDLIYNDNFWRFNTHGGMNEYCISKIGEQRAILPNDFHPKTESHEIFLNDILSKVLDKI